MANLIPTPGWDDVPQLETNTPVLGGPGGVANAQAQALLNRLEALRGFLASEGPGLINVTPGADYADGTLGGWINALETAVNALTTYGATGVIGFSTRALMNADLAHPAGFVAYVTNDPTPANNGTYLKSGISGAGAWTASSFDRVAAVETRTTNIEQASPFVPGGNVALRTVRRLQLFGANPAKYYSLHFYYRNDVGTRFNCTIEESTDTLGTGAVDVAQFVSAGINYSGQQEFSLSAMGASGITGTLVVDFATAPATWGVYRGSGGNTFANLGVRPDRIATSTAANAAQSVAIAAGVVTGLTLVKGRNLPFGDELSNDFLRRFVKNIWVYGADTSHVYILKQIEIQLFRRTVLLHDLTTGTDVAKWSVTSTVTDYTGQPRYVKLVQGSLPTYTGVYAVVEFDWTQATTQTSNYTTAAQAGIHSSQLRSDEMVMDYLDRDVWHEVIGVGAGQTFATLRLAVESLYDSPGVDTCARCCYDHQILIDLRDAGAFNASFLKIPMFVGVRGLGTDKTFIDKESDATDAMLETHLETKFLDLTIRSNTGDGGAWNGEYCLHSDDFNRVSKPTTPNRRIRQAFTRLAMVGGPLQNAWLFGCGVSSGQHIRFTDVRADRLRADTSLADFGFHNTAITASARPAVVELIGCKSSNTLGTGALVLSLGGGNRCRLTLIGSDLGLVAQGVTGASADRAVDRYEWQIGGMYAGPVVQSDAGMVVLQTTLGLAVTGTAAPVIFGSVDELGRGDLCVEDATAKAIGARLGDCTTVNKTLTIAGQTWTANGNYTAQSNAAVLAAMNAVLTVAPVSVVNIQWEVFADCGQTRRLLNSSGVAIPAGRLVKKTGVNTIAMASGDDDVYGVVPRQILPGLSGLVIANRLVHRNYINSSAADGKYGVTAGALDAGAATKKLVIEGGIARLY